MSSISSRRIMTVALAALAAAVVAAAPADALAKHKRHNGGELLAAGIVGLAIGAALAAPPVYAAPVYAQPVYAPPVYSPPVYSPPVYVEPRYYGEPQVYCDPRASYGKYQDGPCRRPMSQYGGGHHPKPKVVTYDDDFGGGYLEPWSQAWMQYCRATYRSFDARTGTYRGYDGQRHFCVAQ